MKKFPQGNPLGVKSIIWKIFRALRAQPSWNRCGGRPVGLAKLGFGVWGLVFGVWGLGFGVWQKKRYARSNWGLGFGFGFGVGSGI